MPGEESVRRSWISGFVTGAVIGGVTVYAGQRLHQRRQPVLSDEAIVIPIE